MYDLLLKLVEALLNGVITDFAKWFSSTHFVDTYLLGTFDLSRLPAGPLTGNPAIVGMHRVTVAIADALLVLIFTWAFLRSQWERSFRAHYTLKTMLPRAMAAIVLAHFSLPIGQMAIDLNNALVHAAWSADVVGGGHQTDWLVQMLNPASYTFPNDQAASSFVHLLMHLLLLVMILILALTYVVRFALLGILLVLAPLAALCMILPETKNYARGWVRLFEVTVFMQFGQVLVLRLASAFVTEQQDNLMQILYGLAILYLVIKVPGLMNASAHVELKAEHMAHKAFKQGARLATHARAGAAGAAVA
jgi:TrbL/VirB6 plasmid conjugal transfer protein